jgi:tetratricopeptide (TPR) repeat protein
MSKSPPEAAPASRPSLIARLLGVPGSLLGLLRRNRIAGLIAVVAGLVIGLSIALPLVFLGEKEQTPAELLAQALAHLDAGDNRQARQLAAELRANKELSFTDGGGPMFVLGVVTAREAEQHHNERQQRTLYLVAARYLETARNRGFPEGRQREGLVLLGQSLHHSGRYSQSLPYLREALAAHPDAGQSLHWLLADGYLQLVPPKLDDALKHVRMHLASPKLPSRELESGMLLEGKILLARRELDAASASLEKIPDASPLHPEAAVLRIRLTLEKIEASLADGTELTAESRAALDGPSPRPSALKVATVHRIRPSRRHNS